MNTLDLEDITVLLEALSAWQAIDVANELITDMLALSLQPENREQIMERRESDKTEKENSRRLKDERVILLKAKLIHLKDSLVAEGVIS